VKKMAALTQTDQDDELTDLSEALRKVESLMRGLLERTAVFAVEVPSKPCLVIFPRWQLMQSIAAVLANSFEAVNDEPKGGRKHEIILRLSVQRWVAVVEVHDTGPGMRPEVRARALNPFFTTRRPGSLGLGLTIAAARVRRAGGEVLIESDGTGTRVRVFLPTLASITDKELAAAGGAFDN
jgi:signal transduction histidine kinase